MALSDELLDRYERDWGEAMEQYEASLRAERMSNVNYDPASRIFEASQPSGSAERLRAAFLDPLQAKWGPLLGRSAGATKTSPTDWSSPIPLGRGGIAQVNRATGELRTNRAPEDAFGAGPFDREATSIRGKKLTSDLRNVDNEIAEQRKLLIKAQAMSDKKKSMDAQLPIMNRISSLSRRRDALFGGAKEPQAAPAPVAEPSYFMSSDEIPFGAPKDPSMFMGDPRNPVIQDPPMAPLASDPFSGAQVGPSTARGLKILSIKQR